MALVVTYESAVQILVGGLSIVALVLVVLCAIMWIRCELTVHHKDRSSRQQRVR